MAAKDLCFLGLTPSRCPTQGGLHGKTRRYAILGAWDSDPQNDILSYKTPLAQALLGKQEGDTATTRIGGNEEDWTVLKIERWVDRK